MIGIAGFLTRQLARVELRHWVGIAASAALHLAVILGWHAAPPPEPQPISFEVSFEPPTATPLPTPKVAAKPAVKKVAKIKQPKQKVAHMAKPKKRLQDNPPREAHLLDATWKAERKAARDVPALVLPDATALGIQADSQQLAQAGSKSQLKSAEATRADAVVPVMATSNGKESSKFSSKDSPSGGQLVEPETASAATQTPAPANEPADGRLALASTASLSAAQNPASAAGGGAQANNTGLALAGGERASASDPARLGAAAPTQTALAQTGAGMQTAAVVAADAATAALAAPAGAEAPGVRLHASQALAGHAALPAASGSMPTSAQAALTTQGSGQTTAELPAQLASTGSKSASGQALRPGSQTPSVSRTAAAQTSSGDGAVSRGGHGQETSGRLAAVASVSAAGSGPAAVKGAAGQPGGSARPAGAIRLAPGEPGSSPGFAVTLQPVLANAPGGQGVRGSGNAGSAPAGAGRASYADAGHSLSAVPAAAGGGQSSRPLLASPTLLVPVSGRVVGGSGSNGGAGVAAAPGQTASIALLNAARETGRPPLVLQATQAVAVKVVRPDTEIQPLDVLAPSNYCPLPLPGHAQPDNRAPQPNRNIAEQPAYALDNPSINYPVLANIRGVEGRVTVRVEVLTSGRPGKMWLKQSSGSSILDQDAQSQLKHWRFVPARKNGQPVTAWIDIPVLYRLSQARP